MSKEPQRVALPSVLRENLQSFRIWQGNEQKYLVNDSSKGQTNLFDPWQFFVLEVIAECDDFVQLSSIFEDRFGTKVNEKEVANLFLMISKVHFLNLHAESHTLISSYLSNRKSGHGTPPEGSAGQPKIEKGGAGDKDHDPLLPGIVHVLGMDASISQSGWKLFDPTPLLKFVAPIIYTFKNLLYILPILLAVSLGISMQHSVAVKAAIAALGNVNFVEHIVFSMLTVNLAATLITALTAYRYRATVPAFCIILYLRVLPRFMVRIGHVQQLTRRERMWLHAAPLLLRLGLFCCGIIMWYSFADRSSTLADFGIILALVSLLSFLLTGCPLVNSNGYNLLAAFFDASDFRQKAYFALINKLKGNVYKESDGNLLSAYLLVSVLFMLMLAGFVLYVLTYYLDVRVGGISILVFVGILLWLSWNTYHKFAELNEDYKLKIQFERWRKRTISPAGSESGVVKEEVNRFWLYARRVVYLFVLVGMFIPYQYDAVGSFEIIPFYHQELTSEVAGTLNEMLYDGGEYIKKGVIIGRLSSGDYEAQLRIFEAKVKEQQAIIQKLKLSPLPEKVKVFREKSRVQEVETTFSFDKMQRLKKLYSDGTVSFEDYEEQRKIFEVNTEELNETKASLALANIGATPEEIVAAVAKLDSIEAEKDFYGDKIEQSVFIMPFDGHLIGMNLKHKIGSYIERGVPLAIAEDSQKVYARIHISETQIYRVRQGAAVTIKSWAYGEINFTGVVTAIDDIVTDEDFNTVIDVQALIKQHDALLKPGMGGYAKVSGDTVLVWQILASNILRFFKVEAWSWLP